MKDKKLQDALNKRYEEIVSEYADVIDEVREEFIRKIASGVDEVEVHIPRDSVDVVFMWAEKNGLNPAQLGIAADNNYVLALNIYTGLRE